MSVETYGSFPDPIASREEKAKDEFGLQYAQAIWSDYSRYLDTYNKQRDLYIDNRTYAEGIEDIDKYKNRLSIDEDSSYVNLDFSPVNKIATIVDNMEGKLMNQTYTVQCTPTDPESITKYDKHRRKLYARMHLAEMGKELEKATGIPLIPKGEFVPESRDDIELHLQLNYKMDAAMAMECAIDWVDDNNDFAET